MSVPLRQRTRVTEKGVLCTQCARRRPPGDFKRHEDGRFYTICNPCRRAYKGWERLTPAEKLTKMAARERLFETEESYRVLFVRSAKNQKLGPMPTSWTARGSCPDACSLKSAGCFAENGLARRWFQRAATHGLSWGDFCATIAALPAGTLWRHNTGGDLPGRGDAIDPVALRDLVAANRGKTVIAFTHKPVLPHKLGMRRPVTGAPPHGGTPTDAERRLWIESNRRAIAHANRNGFPVNLSADSLAEADELARLHIAPVVVVVPSDAPDKGLKTPEGRAVVMCLAETTEGMTCAACRLCAKGDRHSVVGFRSHGQSSALVNEIVRVRRSA